MIDFIRKHIVIILAILFFAFAVIVTVTRDKCGNHDFTTQAGVVRAILDGCNPQ